MCTRLCGNIADLQKVHSLMHPNFGTIRSGAKEKPGDLPAIGPFAEREWNGIGAIEGIPDPKSV
jgi:hypothetical protein